MNYARQRDHARWPPQHGFILVEVMVAIVLLALLLTSLVTGAQRALDAAVALRDRAARISSGDPTSQDIEAWEWGPMIERANWGAGPQLSVCLGAGVGAGVTVGMWTDGWLLGEWEVSGGEVLRLGAATWYGSAGRELVIRGRADDGGWGPPWRSLVPESNGEANIANSALAVGGVSEVGFERTAIAIHVRSWSSPLLSASWTDSTVSNSAQGVVFVPPACTPGICRVESDGRMQDWVNCDGRKIDVYF
jgi:hypothetical protein